MECIFCRLISPLEVASVINVFNLEEAVFLT